MLLRPHLCTMYLWILIRELDSIHTHCGYEFPIQKLINKIVPFYGGKFEREELETAWGRKPYIDSAPRFNVMVIASSSFLGTQFHDYHHAAFSVNFASRTTLLDKIFGTYRDVHMETQKPKRKLNK
jgi:hypothetical protein